MVNVLVKMKACQLYIVKGTMKLHILRIKYPY